MSAPYTTAILANLLSVSPVLKGSKVVEALFDSAESRPHQAHVYGRGIVRGKQSLERTLAEFP